MDRFPPLKKGVPEGRGILKNATDHSKTLFDRVIHLLYGKISFIQYQIANFRNTK